MARQLARGMGSCFMECGCPRPTCCPHPYTIRFRDALGKQREEAGYDAQDDVIERLAQIYAEKKRTAPSVAEARRELGQQTVAEYQAVVAAAAQDDGVLHGLARGQLRQRAQAARDEVGEPAAAYVTCGEGPAAREVGAVLAGQDQWG
ncbi:hypothetical protein [Streptomyces echinatus]|uniref:hypothetical protein n=1 Tax=Streptomyces echinatus TaxID=67293 RepID=UPI003799B1C6